MADSHLSEILGNRQRLDGGAMFGNVPRAVWQTWIQPDELGRIPLECRALLANIGGARVLCETGIGAFFEPKLADRFGVSETTHKLLESLDQLGVDESSIDFVILSHLHFDHAGGLLPAWSESKGQAKRLHFPNAKYVVGREALERAKHPHPRDRASFIPELPGLLEASKRLVVIEGTSDSRVLPQHIEFFYSHGHTPGHMHTVLQGEKSRVIFAGDLIPGRAWVHLPITMGYDRFAEQVIDEKARLYQKYLKLDNDWIFYTHDHEVAISQISQSTSGKFSASNSVSKPVSWKF